MTRGKFAIILDNTLYMSIEFNGDMYPSYNGKLVYFLLNHVKTLDEFIAAIKFFDDHVFHYSEYGDDMECLKTMAINEELDFSVDYIRNFGADYLYIKNLDTKTHAIKNCLGTPDIIKPNEIQIWKFGNKVENTVTELQMTDHDMARLEIATSSDSVISLDAAVPACKVIAETILLLLKEKQEHSTLVVTPVFTLDPKGSFKYKDLTLTWRETVNNNFKIHAKRQISVEFLTEVMIHCINAVNSINNNA